MIKRSDDLARGPLCANKICTILKGTTEKGILKETTEKGETIQKKIGQFSCGPLFVKKKSHDSDRSLKEKSDDVKNPSFTKDPLCSKKRKKTKPHGLVV